MASTYSPKLKFELVGAGEQAGLWGTTTNKNIGELIEQAIAGVTTVDLTSLSGDYTLSSLDGTVDQARSAVISCIGTAAAAVNIVIPTSTKLYVFRNACGFPIVIKTAGQIGGVTLANGEANTVFCDGANAYAGLVTAGSGTTPVGQGGTGANSFTGGFIVSPAPFGSTALTSISSVNLSTMVSGQLSVANGGTGRSSLTANNVLLGDGTNPVQQVAPGANGNVLTSNGTTWQSVAPSGGGAVTSVNASGSNITVSPTVGSVNVGITSTPTFSTVYYGNTSNYITQSANELLFIAGGVQANKFTSGGFGSTGSIVSTAGGYASIGFNSITLVNGSTGMYCDGSVFGWQFNGVTRMQLTSGGATYNTTGTYAQFSDERIKENIVAAPNYLDKVCALNVVNFNFIDDDKKMLGFIAQQVEQVMPGLVEVVDNPDFPDVENLKAVKTTILIPMLVQAVQELKAGLDAAKAEIAALKAK